ncbi:LOW QUALITY PROTEIN: piRNA biogenesis protein EXD1 [Ammospiza maritima maritima]
MAIDPFHHRLLMLCNCSAVFSDNLWLPSDHVCTLQVKIPSRDAMKCRQQVTSENPDIWSLRPFLASLPEAFALKAKYLLLLHSSLMDNLMSDLTTYLNAYTGSGDHFVSTKPICMELPEELCQLAEIQKLRREKVIEDCRMNEDGLLIQPAVEFNRGKQSTEDRNYRNDGDCFPTKKKKRQKSRVSKHILQQSRMYFVKAELENQIHVVNLWEDLKLTSSRLYEFDF